MTPLLAWYGDDLTGSTDVMEALELRGVSAVLFTGIPDAEQRARFAERKAIGIAGTSRSETPEWMDAHLPAAFAALRATGAQLCHYKVCSTFDSAPHVGSIGRALDIGARVFGQASTPVVVGAPELRRYTAFGNLFAGFRETVFRIDRHPVMSRHPVTPMDEADLRLHLGRQTDKEIGLLDLISLKRNPADEDIDARFAAPVVLLDVLDEETQRIVGRHLWRRRVASPFVVGSSGVEYALAAPGSGTPLAGKSRAFEAPGSPGPIAVVSGSMSPTTERQIRYATERGFEAVSVSAAGLIEADPAAEISRAVAEASRALSVGRSPILFTALGEQTTTLATTGGQGHRIGRALGQALAQLVARHGLRRAIVAGGDTSSHAIAELGIYALECLMPLPNSPGSPLCRAHRTAAEAPPLEMAFKGGQVGQDDYFVLARDI
jgi:uncharacterized protein YgbK (DUF1537 family)